MKKINTSKVLYFLAIFVLGFGVGFYVHSGYVGQVAPTTLRENSPNYKYINPLLLSLSKDNIESPEYKPLEAQITDYRNSALKNNKVSDISYYFRDLNTGKWTGVNEDDKYAPGSMLKVAVLLGYLKLADTNPSVLSEEYYYDPKIDEGQYFKPPHMLVAGMHSAKDLIKNMIAESDNTATITLVNKHTDAVNEVYKDLQLPLPTDSLDFMSAKNYSVIWRVLYNSTYLSRSLSEQSLTLLSLTAFNDGLVAGLPKGVNIAHKFGEHSFITAGQPTVRELHDCGIVYPEGKDPYFVCVMTRGADFDSLKTVISDISKITYNHIISTKE